MKEGAFSVAAACSASAYARWSSSLAALGQSQAVRPSSLLFIFASFGLAVGAPANSFWQASFSMCRRMVDGDVFY
jgi:hypothetical protein